MKEMTGYERMMATLQGQPCDRVPVSPIYHYSTTRTCGMLISEYATNSESNARANITAYRKFKYDSINIGSDVSTEAEACGSEVKQPKDAPAHLVRPVIQEYADLDKLHIPDPYKDGRMPMFVESTRICKQEIGGEVMIGSWIMGPMNVASQLRGISNLMFDIIDAPEFFDQILDYAVDVSLTFAKALLEAGADIIMAGEALCSPNFTNPEIYRTHILQREQRLFSEIMKSGAAGTVNHICGDVSLILHDMGKSEATILDIDTPVSMKKAKTESGLIVRGNINPSSVLLRGTKEQVLQEAKNVLDEAKNGGGLILGSGCDVSPDTPLDNVAALVEASKLYGRYEM